MNDEEFGKLYDDLIQAEFAGALRWRRMSAKGKAITRLIYDRGRNDGYEEGEKDGRAAWAAARPERTGEDENEDTQLGHADPARWSKQPPRAPSVNPPQGPSEVERLKAELARRDETIARLRGFSDVLRDLATQIADTAAPQSPSRTPPVPTAPPSRTPPLAPASPSRTPPVTPPASRTAPSPGAPAPRPPGAAPPRPAPAPPPPPNRNPIPRK